MLLNMEHQILNILPRREDEATVGKAGTVCRSMWAGRCLKFRKPWGGTACGGGQRVSWRSAFTMVELLLVVVVIGIALAMSLPSFVKAIQGQRIRAASRTLVTVSRYARGMAVLKQTDLNVRFNLDTGQIDVVGTNISLPPFSREVNGVRIDYVEVEGAQPLASGICTVPFRRSGVCVPFEAQLIDQRGNTAMIKVDALGSVKSVTYGQSK